MTGIVLDFVYALGLLVSSPMWLYRMICHARYRSDIGQRFGAVPTRYGLQPTLWVHGVSLGEVNAARPIVDELHSQLPDYRVVVSTTTETGMEAARKHFAPSHIVFRWPFDFTFAVRRALRRMRPALVVLMEGEVWPNFLAECNRRGVPVVVVNGRMSPDKGYPRYRKLGPLARKLFNRLGAIGVQDESYAERFRALGVDADKVHVTGMIKFDSVEVSDGVSGQEPLAAAMALGEGGRLLVAGGTGPGEEEIVLNVYAELRKMHPSLRLAIVPRKPERFDEVAKRIEQTGHTLLRRSQRPDGCDAPAAADAVILGDTMGELRKFYSLAEVVFVGRSLVPMGGSDMIESAALGKPTCYGPHAFNFPQASELAANGCSQVSDADGLRRQLDAWLSDPADAKFSGQRAQDYVRSRQGATKRNVEMICHVLHRTPAVAPGAIATEALEQTVP